MNDIDEDGSSIILSQLHQQEMNDIEKNVKDLNAEITRNSNQQIDIYRHI